MTMARIENGLISTRSFFLLLCGLSLTIPPAAAALRHAEGTWADSSRFIVPCPATDLDTASWTAVKQDRFTFRLPPEFHEVKLDGAVDSWVRQFASIDSTVFVTFDWGWYSDPLTGAEIEHYSESQTCEERIGGRSARIVTLWPLGAGTYGDSDDDRRYGAGAAWRDIKPGVHLTFFGWAADARGLEQLLGIFRTVRFSS
jgi:hypothetical protein